MLTRRRAIGALLLLCLTGCGGCEDDGEVAPPAAPSAAGPEPWTLGASDEGDLVLPPTCSVTESLAAVAARRTRLHALTGDLTHVVAVEGHLVPTRGRPQWSPDAAGVMGMRHGSAQVTSLPWSPSAWVAGSGARPRVTAPGGDGWSMWRGEAAATSLPLNEVSAFACDDRRCVAAGRSDGGHALWVDDDVDDDTPGLLVPLPPEGEPRWVTAGRSVAVGLEGDLRLRILELEDDLTLAPRAALPVVGGVLAALPAPRLALVRRETAGADCEPDEGGVMLVAATGSPRWLRAPLPARRGTLHRLGSGDLLATWSSPVRCASSREVLHAAVTDGEGRLRGPVVEVGRSDDWAVATAGDELALWIRHDEGGGTRQTIRYVRARCVAGAGATEGDRVPDSR